MILDYDQTARELIVALRAHRSQTALSRRLGFQSNVVYTWESGRRWPTGAQVLYVCHRTGIDVHAALVKFIGREPEWIDRETPWSVETVAAMLQDLRRWSGDPHPYHPPRGQEQWRRVPRSFREHRLPRPRERE